MKPRVLFLIKSKIGNEDRRIAQMQSWIKNIDIHSDYRFVICYGNDDSVIKEGFDTILIPMVEDREFLPKKMKLLCNYISSDHRLRGYDYIVTMDDDVLVNVERFYDFLEDDPDYFGNRWDGTNDHISGMMVGYSKIAFQIMVRSIVNMQDQGHDDLLMSILFKRSFRRMNLHIMTDKHRFRPRQKNITDQTIAVEIYPFSPEAMKEFKFN